jgi:hypothetical protein
VLDTLADLPFAPASYAIENVVNGKVYVVSSLNARRGGNHFATPRQGRHPNRYLQHPSDKHGEAALALTCSNRCLQLRRPATC